MQIIEQTNANMWTYHQIFKIYIIVLECLEYDIPVFYILHIIRVT